MRHMYMFGAAALHLAALYAPETETGAAEATERKSIVPAGWKSKNDELAQFINEQCTGKDGFEYPAFFTLCRKNIGGSLTEDKIAHYEGLVNEKAHGSQGRAKMTLRNMLATLARKNGKLVGLNGEEVAISLPEVKPSGAAAKAQEAAAANDDSSDEGGDASEEDEE